MQHFGASAKVAAASRMLVTIFLLIQANEKCRDPEIAV
jgi:hypothetical protein